LLVDKRLDEWIDLEKFDLEKGEQQKNVKTETDLLRESTERKITRNQKRKNDIISGV
jgi:hypothetical protein